MNKHSEKETVVGSHDTVITPQNDLNPIDSPGKSFEQRLFSGIFLNSLYIRMFIRTKHLALLLSFIAALLTAGCNSDGVITDSEDNAPASPNGYRPPSAKSSASATKVYEWTPAPGQFINDTSTGLEWPASLTAEQAAERALANLQKRYTVSLGSFGGYIVVGFDHSIANSGDRYEIGVFGNAFISASGNSNEPGIVYVMQDTNRNGLPDDTWYELRGSDTMAESTVRNYSVTYYRPEEAAQPVRWTDNLGNSGEVAYVGTFHDQPSYYPVWVKAESYTLSGTRLQEKTVLNTETGNWDNPPFGWGYADNLGSDNFEYDGIRNCNRFRISEAIDADGNQVVLPYIDFVKIQTGICANAGWLGDVSTEVAGVVDLTLK